MYNMLVVSQSGVFHNNGYWKEKSIAIIFVSLMIIWNALEKKNVNKVLINARKLNGKMIKNTEQ